MALDGLSLNNIGIIRDLVPGEIQHQAQESSKLHLTLKKIEEVEKSKIDPDKQKDKQKQQQNKKEQSQDETLKGLFQEIAEERKSDIEVDDYSKIINLTENKSKYKVVYNSYKEIVEIVHIKTGRIKETLTLEELKTFVMKVKNPLGIIVDKTG